MVALAGCLRDSGSRDRLAERGVGQAFAELFTDLRAVRAAAV